MFVEHSLHRLFSPAILITILSRCVCIKSLHKIHALLIVNGLEEHEPVVKGAVDSYLSFGNPCPAVSASLSVKKPTLLFQNLVHRSFSNQGYHAHLLSLYAAWQHSGHRRSDNFTFPVVIKACAARSAIRTGNEVHCAVIRTGYGGCLVVQTALVDFYSKIGILEYARKLFDRITKRDLVSWNALISGYSLNGRNQEALQAFREMILAEYKPNGSTFVSVIPLCTRLRDRGLGGSLHSFAFKCGVFADDALIPTLISMHAAFGDLATARTLFENREVKDLVSWNSMISAYSQNGKPCDALEIFQLMHGEGERPDYFTMVSVISSCCDLFDISCGKSVHSIAIKVGLADKISVLTSLLSMYAKSKKLQAAEHLFLSVPEKNLLLCNSMLSGYLLNGLLDMVLSTFQDMIIHRVHPDPISIISILSACGMSGFLHLGKSLHAYSIRSGFHTNINLLNALLAFYSDCDEFHCTLKLFNVMQDRNVVSWNTIICGWAGTGNSQSAVDAFRKMGEEDVKFDLITMISILPNFYKPENIALGKSFHAMAMKSGFDSDTTLRNALISMYTNCGSLEDCHTLFESLAFRSTISWNALLTGYRKFKPPNELMKLFDQMQEDGQHLNMVTLLNLFPSCETLIQGKSIHAFAIRNFHNLETSIYTSAMCMYSRFQNIESCCRLFSMMDKRNAVSWNTIMSIYAHREHSKVFPFFKEMLDFQVSPDTVTMLNLVSACSQLGTLVLAQCVHSFIIHKGFGSGTTLINSLIDVYGRTGSIITTKKLFDELQEKDLISWSTIINVYAMHGDGEAAIGLFIEMQATGIRPDDITFVSILSACSHAGLVEEGRRFFKKMVEKYHITPRMEHYACLIDLLSRSGHLSEAFDLVRKLPFRPSVDLLESLLGACHFHGDSKVAEEVRKLLLEFHPGPSSYVILSNIYSAGERWEDSGRLRCDMRAKAMRKVPGTSFTGIG
ncbi:Pentatricopeptide repeat-containing protein [Platanthera zijinensis]|uniref:Pentatricopeptide repeat-containing protein n=1 Tax=Platanthera zijinensis TaxID=2320716 RepID=A0AAP0G758_9ASPA